MKGDFLGFSFDGIHSSSLGITRVSDGDRYEEALFPEIKDRSNEIVGNDGEIFYGSTYGPYSFSISIAFDSMTETQFRRMRRLFGTRKTCELIFDERPYKVYMAKISSPIELEYVCFDEPLKTIGEARDGVRVAERNGEEIIREQVTPIVIDQTRKQRIYKGEGTIEFICYYPFARQLFKKLDLYTNSNLITTYNNVDEWAESSGILSAADFNKYNIDKTLALSNNNQGYNLEIPVYNPGDLNVGFYLYIPFPTNGVIVPANGARIKIRGDENGLLLKPIVRKTPLDNGIIINSVNRLIEGVSYDPLVERNDYRTKSWTRSKALYNECIVAGDFPQILKSDWYFDNEQFKQAIYLNCLMESGQERKIQINYDYLYF